MEIKFQVTGRKLKRKMFIEQFSLLPRMVEIVTVTHKLLISICPALFAGFQMLKEQGLSVEACHRSALAHKGRAAVVPGTRNSPGGWSFHISLGQECYLATLI